MRFLDSFPDDPTANEGRVAHVELKVKNATISHCHVDFSHEQKNFLAMTEQGIIDIFGIYFPNGGKSEDAWKGKIVFYAEFAQYMDALRESGHHVLWG